jgi:hypothetical protein
MSLLTRRVMNNEIIQSLIGNAIITTAYLANELCIQTSGQNIIPEEDYLYIVKDFQTVISKRIMPVKSQDDIKEEAKKYIKELLSRLTKESENESTNGLSHSSPTDPASK